MVSYISRLLRFFIYETAFENFVCRITVGTETVVRKLRENVYKNKVAC